MARYSLLVFLFTSSARASGEIAFIRVPEEIPEGDDITVIVSASPRETGIDRTLAIDFPASWKLKRAYRVEAGSDHAVRIPQAGEISSLFAKEPGDNVLSFADVSDDFDPNADGIAYFIVFTTKPLTGGKADQSATVKAALVERSNPNAPREIDPKTKRPKPINTEWRMVFPPKLAFSFTGITSKRLIATVRLERITENARALVAEGKKNAVATLHTRPELLAQFFNRPFSIECWFRTTGIQQTFLQLDGDKTKLQLGTGLLGQPLLRSRGAENKVIEAVRAIVNDGTWHNLVLSRDSTNKLRLFIDAGLPTIVDLPKELFQNITSVEIGDSASEDDFSIDELRLSRSAYRDPSEFEEAIVTSARDTSQQAFAIFHFDEFGWSARSSVPLLVTLDQKGEYIPIFFALDSGTRILETSSPVQPDPVMLNVDLISSTRVGVHWNTTSELGVKQYRLERRIGTFGAFEKVLSVDAKHGMKSPKRGQSIVSRNSYSAQEDLPKLGGDIELYYRLVVAGFNEKEPLFSSIPVKLEYGADRDVFVEQNDPNPFNPTTVIAFRLTKPEVVRLSVFDIIGREVAVLENGKLDPGRHAYPLDATNWPGGIYFYKVKTARTTITRKMVLAK
jgi:hypothetical protein